MRTGLYLSLEHGREDDMAARLRDLCEIVRTARDAGFELLLAGQHFLCDLHGEFDTLEHALEALGHLTVAEIQGGLTLHRFAHTETFAQRKTEES